MTPFDSKRNSGKMNGSNKIQFKPFRVPLVEFIGHGTTAFAQEFQ